MSGPISVGYLRPNSSRVRSKRPEIHSGTRIVTEARVPDWHYLTDITVEWDLEIDLKGLIEDCDLSAAAQIGAMLGWRSERTNLRGNGNIVRVIDGTNVNLAAVLPGADLGGTVTIEARVVLVEPDTAAGPFAPRRSGSLLWQDAHRMVLEGSGGRFPTTAIDFDSAGLAGGKLGLWYLEISGSDLEASATQALRLYLNSANDAICAMLASPDSDKSIYLMGFLRYETARQLLAVAINNEEFDDRAEYDRGTLGDVLVTLLRIYFPDRDVTRLRSDCSVSPAELDAELLAAVWREPT